VSVRQTHDRVFVDGKYIPVAGRTPELLARAAFEGTLRVHKQHNDRRILVAGDYLGMTELRPVVDTTGEPSKPRISRETIRQLDAVRSRNAALYRSADVKQTTIKEGFLYVLVHPLFDDWVSVGQSTDPIRRLVSYNRGCPNRAYKMVAIEYFADRRAAEKKIHRKLAKTCTRRGEWFRAHWTFVVDAVQQLSKKESRDNDNPCSGHRDRRAAA